MSDWEEMRKAAQKVQTIMPGHGVMLNAASVLAILADRETLKKERDQAREELSTWRSVFPDIAPDSVLPDRSKVEARVAALTALLEKAARGLRPFARVADSYERDEDGRISSEVGVHCCVLDISEPGDFLLGQLRLARSIHDEIEAALAQGKSAVGEKT